MIDVDVAYDYGDPKGSTYSHALGVVCSWCLYRGGHASNCPSASH